MQAASHQRAFTLIELLAVVAIVLVLMAILIPLTGAVTERSRRIICFNNVRQLQLAFNMATSDRGGRLPSSDTGPAYGTGSNDWWAGSYDLTIGCVWPYIRNAKSYTCPSYPPSGLAKNLQRHYSLSVRLGSTAAGAADALYSVSQVKSPPRTHVFAEEYDNRTTFALPSPGPLDGFVIPTGGYRPVDCPPTWHSMGANFSYLDGHAEYRAWVGATMPTVNCDIWFDAQRFAISWGGTAEDRNDWDYLVQGVTNAFLR